jgi:hypothetical protein
MPVKEGKMLMKGRGIASVACLRFQIIETIQFSSIQSSNQIKNTITHKNWTAHWIFRQQSMKKPIIIA